MFPKKLTRQVICDLDKPIASVKDGKLRGVIVDDTYIFRGVKYADAKRFHMPEKVRPWDGVKDAIVYGPVSPEIHTPIAHDEYNVPHYHYIQDEACQYLNIWTRHLSDGAKRPVMVWIHGGGYSTGSSVELYAYDGENLAVFGDVVVVSLNHRLNCIGYLDMSKYGEEYKYSGNVGMADIVAALEWVRDNIAEFGGDASNVTIMGQSGGGGKVTTLMQMPAADGLYHRAVIQSGIMRGGNTTTADAQALAAKVLENLGIAESSAAELENVPYYKLARAAQAATETLADEGKRVSWGPVTDGEYYMGYPLTSGFRKETLDVPMLIGSVLGEFQNNFNNIYAEGSKNDWDDALVQKILAEQYGDAADAVVAAFKKAYPEKKIVDSLFVDTMVREATAAYGKLRVESGSTSVYTWLFNLECPLNSGTLPWHNAEEAYMFHNAEYLEASYIPGVSEWLQDIMTGAWVAFAKTGNPNHPGMPMWHELTPDNYATMLFDTYVKMAYGHDRELIAAIPRRPMNFGGARRPKSNFGGGPRQSL